MELSNIKLKITSLLSNIKLKYIIILVVVIIIVEAGWAYQTIKKNNQLATQSQSGNVVFQVKSSNTISLSAPKLQFSVGEIIPIGINIESDKLTAGTDLIIHYDANLLSLAPNTSKVPVVVGGIYDEYPLNQVDEKTGTIAVSGITNKSGGVTPKGLFGTILFQTKAVGSARIFLEFVKGRTNDTNIIESKSSNDVLEEVKNVDIKINP